MSNVSRPLVTLRQRLEAASWLPGQNLSSPYLKCQLGLQITPDMDLSPGTRAMRD